jgi:hypothetical protein
MEDGMKKFVFIALLSMVICIGFAAYSQDKMVITFIDGKVQSIDLKTISKIEYKASATCWTGHFSGTDISGYAMDINLVETDGRVEGGYTYYHKAQGQDVTAILTVTVVEGDTLKGTWKQIKGILAEGRFEWKWLPNERCRAFEGTFDGTKYWQRMNRQ